MLKTSSLIAPVAAVVALAVPSAGSAMPIGRAYYPPAVTTQYIHHDVIPASSTAREYFTWFFDDRYSYTPYINYGGGTSVAGGLGDKRLVIRLEVLGRDGKTWHEIAGSRFVAPALGWTGWTHSALRADRYRPIVLRHVYRTVVTAVMNAPYPKGHTNMAYITSVTNGWSWSGKPRP